MENRASSPAADQPISNTTDHPHLSGHILPRTTITNTGDVSSHGDVAVTSDVTTGARLVQVKMVSAALAACIAEATTIPLDTAKVRLQIQGERLLLTQEKPPHRDVTRANVISKATLAPHSPPKYRGMLRTLHVISQEEGFRALYNGLVPGLQRQLAFASIRIGLYDSVKAKYIELYQAEGTVNGSNIGPRILAGITTGAAAVGCAQPTDVVKVRMQAQSSGPKRYSGSINAYRTIAVQEGIRGLWKGLCPNMARNAIVNASELVSYDLIKEAILRRRLLSDNTPCHFVSAFGAGFCTTVVASPVDVVKTRFMNSGKGVYSGALQCATKMFREGGLATFYKGFMPSFMRVGSWNVAMFVSYEQIQRLFVTTRHPPNELTHSTASNATLAGSQEDVLPPAQHA